MPERPEWLEKALAGSLAGALRRSPIEWHPGVESERLADAGLPFRVEAEHGKMDQIVWLIDSPRMKPIPTHDPVSVF